MVRGDQRAQNLRPFTVYSMYESLLKSKFSFVIHRLNMEEDRGTINGVRQQFVTLRILFEEYTLAYSSMSRNEQMVH
jgi:hypothetical protein